MTSTTTSTEVVTSNAFTEEPKLLNELVGEGKKFRDTEALARGKKESDDFIVRLQEENAQIRKELQSRPTADEITNRVKDTLSTVTKPTTEVVNQPTPFTKADLQPVVKEILAQTQQQDRARVNVEEVTVKLDTLYGDRQKASKFLADKASELGVSIQYLEQTAAQSPKAFYSLVGVTDNPNTQTNSTRTKGSISTDSLKQGTDESWEGFQKLRRENKAKYFSPAVQNRIHELKRTGKLVLPE